MPANLSRRSALGLGAATLGVVGLAEPAAAAPRLSGLKAIKVTYEQQKAKAGGTWHTHIAGVDTTGAIQPIVEDDADHVTYGYSVQKLALATALLDKIDRGVDGLTLGTLVELPDDEDFILGGTGIYLLQPVWGDQLTIANFLTALLLVSDNTAVRLCGLKVPALEINEILAAKGFVHTRVEPVANPNRFYLGTTTPREIHDLLWRLANGTLLSAASTKFFLDVLRWTNGYMDGVRRVMSSNERSRIATKYGADFNTLGASRHEAGIIFGTDGLPKLTYSMFAEGLGDLENYGSTHPAVQAHAIIGRTMLDNLPAGPAATAALRSAAGVRLEPFVPNHGG